VGYSTASTNVYFSEGVLWRDHVVVQQIANMLQLGLQSASDLYFVLVEVQHFNELFPVNKSFRFVFAVV